MSTNYFNFKSTCTRATGIKFSFTPPPFVLRCCVRKSTSLVFTFINFLYWYYQLLNDDSCWWPQIHVHPVPFRSKIFGSIQEMQQSYPKLRNIWVRSKQANLIYWYPPLAGPDVILAKSLLFDKTFKWHVS